jgi:hypothetical protein
MQKNPLQQVIAVCDVDKNYLANGKRRVDDFTPKPSARITKRATLTPISATSSTVKILMPLTS